jgi:pimeloyl-ACP methyl ester carboxylesterase
MLNRSHRRRNTVVASIQAQDLAVDGSPAASAVRPFHVDIPEKALADLRHRVAQTRFADKETVDDQSQGVQLATIRELARYWGTDYDLRRIEKRLNSVPQFVTQIDGVDVHFIHVRSKKPNALPLLITHGWPGSVIELLNVIDPLTRPTARTATPTDSFDVVIPSLPGYGFSGKPTAPGWDPARIARAWDALMKRLRYTRYVAQGGDWGAIVTEIMQRHAPEGLLGVHINALYSRPPEIDRALARGEPAPDGLSDAEKAAFDQLRARGSVGYTVAQGTRPQTIGQSLVDSPVGLAAWLIDHDKRSYEKMSNAFLGQAEGNLTRDEILDNITLYWLTRTGASSARLYWESRATVLHASQSTVPVAMTVFPDEYYRAPRSWVEAAYPNVVYFNQAPRGGHFAAWEEPQLFTEELNAALKLMR